MAEPCPDCERPRKVLGGCIIRGGDSCVRAERDRLRLELAAVEKLNAAERRVVEAAATLHEYWNKVDAIYLDWLKRKSEETTRLSDELERLVGELLALRAAEANRG
jgi:tRNA(Phe) wybutosine-synthesizing methylase Tyw3